MYILDKNARCFLILTVLLLICFSLYWPGLNGPLVLDDFPQLSPLLDKKVNWQASLTSESGLLKRPVSMVSFLLNSLLSGDNLFWWKLTNVVIHLLNAVLVFLLSLQLFSAADSSGNTQYHWPAIVLSGIWLLHPLHVSTVLYTVQRMTELSSLFVFLGLFCYVMGRRLQLKGDSGNLELGLCFFLFLPLAVFSKESGALLPLLTLLIEVFLFRFNGESGTRKRLLIYYSVFLLIPFIFGLYFIVSSLPAGYEGRVFTLGERIFTEFRVIWLYIFQLVLPIQSNMGFFHDDFVISHGWFNPATTILSLTGIILLFILALKNMQRMPLVALGIVFFFAAHSMESTILPLELVFEHRNYLPSFGLFLALVSFFREAKLNTPIVSLIATMTLVSLAALTLLRVNTWSSETSLYNYAYTAHPHSQRVTAIISENLTRQKNYDQALKLLAPIEGNGALLQRLYIHCIRDKQLSSTKIKNATTSFLPFFDDQASTGLIELARLGLEKECRFSFKEFTNLLNRATQLNIAAKHSKQKIWLYQAQYYWELGERDKAIATLDKTFNAEQDNPIPLFLATEWLIDLGDKRALSYFSKAKAVAKVSRHSYDRFIHDIDKKLKTHHAD